MQQNNQQKKILIIGGYGFSNIGDEAILSGLLKYLEIVLGYNKNLYSITVFSKNPHETMSIHGVNATNKIIHEILRSDIIIIGGGELFSEYKQLFYKNLFLVILSKLLNKQVYLIGIGIDIKKSINKFLARYIFKLVDKISVRDRSSLQILHNLGISNAQLIQDLAFYNLKPRYSPLIDNFMVVHRLIPNNFIIVVPRPSTDSHLLSLYVDIIKALAKDNRIVLVPFSRHPSSYDDNDLNMISLIKKMCVDLDLVIFDCENLHPNEVLYFISKSKLVVSSRLHPLIFARVVGIKSIAILPSVQATKVRTFAEENDIPIIIMDSQGVTEETDSSLSVQ
ncbi:MAG: polysaccharide pyruvyl transferase family protein [Candidatus Nitrosocaldaceae archaeon]